MIDMEHEYHSFTVSVLDEIYQVTKTVDTAEVDNFVEEILRAEKVFFIAVGRVFLSLQCMAKRLSHLGIDCHVVGSITEKAITSKDLLVVASGSGESKVPVIISQIAKKHNAKVGLITSAEQSTIKSMADLCVHLKCPTKTNMQEGVKSIQPMSTLFDQSLHVFGDILSLIIQNRKSVHGHELWKYHANLE
ncbi:SIS domain-containing protein [Candidatus Berkelbacteria bacterium]|nr:SIS domain-containing protein [Candidatus Berkelbacteria bacterium]